MAGVYEKSKVQLSTVEVNEGFFKENIQVQRKIQENLKLAYSINN